MSPILRENTSDAAFTPRRWRARKPPGRPAGIQFGLVGLGLEGFSGVKIE